MSPAPSPSLPRSTELRHVTEINGKPKIGDHHNGLTLHHTLSAVSLPLAVPGRAASSPSVRWGTLGS